MNKAIIENWKAIKDIESEYKKKQAIQKPVLMLLRFGSEVLIGT